jgi:hypothetical protein
MKKAFAVVFLVAAAVLFAAAGQAAPFTRLHVAGPGLAIPVADGCWLGWHRNPSGGCSRDLYGLLGMGIDYKPGPFYPTGPNVCRGRGMFQICNIFGYCWWACS